MGPEWTVRYQESCVVITSSESRESAVPDGAGQDRLAMVGTWQVSTCVTRPSLSETLAADRVSCDRVEAQMRYERTEASAEPIIDPVNEPLNVVNCAFGLT